MFGDQTFIGCLKINVIRFLRTFEHGSHGRYARSVQQIFLYVPAAIKISTTSIWPSSEAKIKGVEPPKFAAFKSAPLATSTLKNNCNTEQFNKNIYETIFTLLENMQTISINSFSLIL